MLEIRSCSWDIRKIGNFRACLKIQTSPKIALNSVSEIKITKSAEMSLVVEEKQTKASKRRKTKCSHVQQFKNNRCLFLVRISR